MGFNSVLKSKNLYLLYLLPFILVAIAFLRFTLDGDGGIICRENGLISFPFLNENQHLLWLKAAGMFVLLCLSFLGPVQIFIPYYRVACVALCFDVGGNYLSLWRE